MAGELLYSGATATGANLLTTTLTCRGLAIETITDRLRASLPVAGTIQIYLGWGDAWIPVGTPLAIGFKQILDIPYSSYRLGFTPARGLTQALLNFYQFTLPLQLMAISPGAARIPVSGPDVATTLPASITNVVLMPANPLRVEGYILNNSNRILWVNFAGIPATAAAPNTPIPANGGNIDIPEWYVGAVNGIWAGPAPTLGADVHEFSQA
jgi:hypothetical protein